ncbi:MAG TPA: HDOD domain-containing protein [Candidatus Acidoferrum sp.]|nr:HDOD domain-containing protein [Candidatus Acidoferrum sp.]
MKTKSLTQEPKPVATERFVARQPIFDKRLKVFGYELLFRAGPENFFRPHEAAAGSVIADSLTLFDLQTLVGHARAFVNIDEASLLRDSARLLPKDHVVLELLETITPSAEVVAACAQLAEDGYTLALDDFFEHAKWEPLIETAEFIKVDFRVSDEDARRAISEKYLRRGKQLLAEKVETEAELKGARNLGYTYFQGYFFCRPAMVSTKEIPGNKLNYVRLLNAIAARELNFEKIEEIFRQDPSLTYRLLRYLNSPLKGFRSEINNIRHAITLLGEVEFRRWVAIVAVVSLSGGKPPELVRTALTRAYFCEEIARPAGMAAKGPDLFLMGLLSVTDALLDLPIEQVLKNLPITEEIREALTDGEGQFRSVYEALLAYERADWATLSKAASRVGPIEEAIPRCYVSAAGRAGLVTA